MAAGEGGTRILCGRGLCPGPPQSSAQEPIWRPWRRSLHLLSGAPPPASSLPPPPRMGRRPKTGWQTDTSPGSRPGVRSEHRSGRGQGGGRGEQQEQVRRRQGQAGCGWSGGDLRQAAGHQGGRDMEPVGAWAVEGEGVPSAAGGGVTRRARDPKETERTRAREGSGERRGR